VAGVRPGWRADLRDRSVPLTPARAVHRGTGRHRDPHDVAMMSHSASGFWATVASRPERHGHEVAHDGPRRL
jgi:hypothetical protein